MTIILTLTALIIGYFLGKWMNRVDAKLGDYKGLIRAINTQGENLKLLSCVNPKCRDRKTSEKETIETLEKIGLASLKRGMDKCKKAYSGDLSDINDDDFSK
jgi:hypothetical protein